MRGENTTSTMPLRNLNEAKYPASCYATGQHPQFPFERNCTGCELTTGCSVGWSAPDDLSKVKLIVISDHPGFYEHEFGFSQVPVSLAKQDKRRTKLPPRRNSGQLIRDLIEDVLGLCSWSEVYYTNALKCDPMFKGRKINVSETKHFSKCLPWLRREFEWFEEYCPTAPILCAGSNALRALQILFPSFSNGKVNDLRRKTGLSINEHSVIVTFNPAAPAKCDPRLETKIDIKRGTGIVEVTEVKWWWPPPPGTPLWVFIKDIEMLVPRLKS